MTLKNIKQNHAKVMGLKNIPSSLGICNAYIDQALMNFSYEQMKVKEQGESMFLFSEMLEKFNKIRGR